MKSFTSLGALATHLVDQQVGMVVALEAGLERIAQKIEKTAKKEIGTYQPEVGPFGAWPELADSTKDQRVRMGYSENEPLLRSGELRDSIEHETAFLETVIGSTSDIMPYHEFGTRRIPARAILGPAAFRNKAYIEKVAGAALVTGIFGVDIIHPSLGYDFETFD